MLSNEMDVNHSEIDAAAKPFTTNTLYPTCTGTSVFAIQYDGGVAVLADRLVSYGKSARFKGVGRQYRVNERCLITFGGDHSDFQYLQNVVERRQEELRAVNRSLVLTPKMLHAYLTSFLYYRRSKMNPIWNTLVIAGLQPVDDQLEPFIGVITQRGVAYETKSLATGIGAMLLNELLERQYREKAGRLTRDDALAIMRKAMELTIYTDCVTGNEYDIATIDAERGVVTLEPESIVGSWQIAECNNQYF